jgi:hypothetical protein
MFKFRAKSPYESMSLKVIGRFAAILAETGQEIGFT